MLAYIPAPWILWEWPIRQGNWNDFDSVFDQPWLTLNPGDFSSGYTGTIDLKCMDNVTTVPGTGWKALESHGWLIFRVRGSSATGKLGIIRIHYSR